MLASGSLARTFSAARNCQIISFTLLIVEKKVLRKCTYKFIFFRNGWEISMTSRVLAACAVATFCSITAEAALAFEIPEAFISNFSVTESASGVSVAVPGKIYLGADASISAAPTVRVHAVADLSDLQKKIPAIIATIPLPSNNCGSYSPKNAVVTLSTSRLVFANGEALFHTEGSAVIWECVQNPVPNSKVDICMKKIGPLKTKVPCVHTWPGNPIKTILGKQPFAIDLPLGIKVDGAGSIRLVPGEAKMTLSGQYVDITNAILNAFKVNLNAKLTDAIQKAIDPKKVTASIPKEFLDAGFAFQEAKFVTIDSPDDLGVDVRADVKVTKQTAVEAA